MLNRSRGREINEHTEARRRREDEAPRLLAEVPTLVTLSLTIEEQRSGGLICAPHIRRIVVERAPALFVFPCSASGCAGGEHDITYGVMHELRGRAPDFRGEKACIGCDCVLWWNGSAGYR